MDNRLTQAGIIAIPLKPQPASGLKPMPTHIVFESQFGRIKTPQINIQTGELEDTDCVQTVYKIVSREILLPNEVYADETFMERVLLPSENLAVPVNMLPLFFSYERVKANVAIINTVFSFFSFRGYLEGYVLEVDEDVVDLILAGQ